MKKLELITLRNSNHAVLEVLNYGATVTDLKIPDKNKDPVSVILGLNDYQDYISQNYLKKGLFLGSTVGRYAGRISKGGFSVNEQEYKLHSKDRIHLHGGQEGFDRKFWVIEHVEKGENPFVILSYVSEHLEEGYPGKVKVTVQYQLTEENTFNIIYRATTDRATHINLTNHSYFNLNGKGSILDQKLHINSNRYLEVDNQLIPTGNFKDSNGTRFDFMEASSVPPDFLGLDDVFVLNNDPIKASIYAESTGIYMRVKSNQPAMVVYTPKVLRDLRFKEDVTYTNFPAICFETQKFPDSPNNLHFLSTLLIPENEYTNETSFEFSIK